MRLIEADDYRLAYLTSHAPPQIHSLALAVSVTTSSCHGERMFYGRTGKLLCFQCRQPCGERGSSGPRSSAQRGGGNTIRVKETRPIDRDRGHREFWRWWFTTRDNRALFEVPLGVSAGDWTRVLAAWDLFLSPRVGRFDLAAQIGRVIYGASEPELWNADSVAVWVGCARRVVVKRVTGDEIPGPAPRMALVEAA